MNRNNINDQNYFCKVISINAIENIASVYNENKITVSKEEK